MLVEIPECRRCCCCIPLRYGLIVWGYLKLALVSLALVGASIAMIVTGQSHKSEAQTMVIISLLIVIFVIDIASSVMFVVGCHKKSVKLMKIFYYYSMFPLALTILLTVYAVIINLKFLYEYITSIFFIYIIMDASAMFIYIAIQVYVILLVRSEIIKLKNGCQFRFVNNINEAECTLNMEQQTEIKLTE